MSAPGGAGATPVNSNRARQALARFALQQAANVSGAQFHAQVKQPSGSFARGAANAQPGPATTQLRVSEDGQMAIEDTNLQTRQPKVFYATSRVVDASNGSLRRHKSEYELYVDQKNAITVADQGGRQVQLHRILSKRRKTGSKTTVKGMGVTVPEVCDAVASKIVGQDVGFLLPRLEKSIALNAQTIAHEYKVARWFMDRLKHGEATALANVNVDLVTATTAEATREQVTQDYMTVLMNAPMAARIIAEELGVNEFADPHVGQTFGSFSLGKVDRGAGGIADYGQDPTGATRRAALTDTPGVGSGTLRDIWGTHWGAVVAESAGNKVTLENYGRKGEDPTNTNDDPVYYFQMYGPTSNAAQTWHGQWSTAANPIINPLTMVYG